MEIGDDGHFSIDFTKVMNNCYQMLLSKTCTLKRQSWTWKGPKWLVKTCWECFFLVYKTRKVFFTLKYKFPVQICNNNYLLMRSINQY